MAIGMGSLGSFDAGVAPAMGVQSAITSAQG